jgi:hypothetical protein
MKNQAKKRRCKMACGEFAKPIYKLLEDLGGEKEAYQKLFESLVYWMSGHEIEEFVEDFRRDHDMLESEEEESE